MTVQQLQSLTVLLNLERSGEKSVLAVRIAEYVRSPKDLGASKPAPRKSATSTKKKSVVAKGGKKKAAASKKKVAPKTKKAAAPKKSTQPKKEQISEAVIHTDSEDEKIIAEVSKEVGGHGHHKH